MEKIGFEYYGDRPEPVLTRNRKTPKERFEDLDAVKKKHLLDSFAEGIEANKLTHKGINRFAIRFFYEKMIHMSKFSKALMQGEVVMEPEEKDENGVVTKEAVLNTPPKDFIELRIMVVGLTGIDLSLQDVENVLNKMIVYASPDKKGDWNFYKGKVKPKEIIAK